MKSNITLASNIYVRANRDIQQDPDFVAQVTGRSALQKLKSYVGTLSSIRLSPWQEQMHSQDTGCTFARNGEKTHGLIRRNGHLVWEGRCEYSLCHKFSRSDLCTQTAKFNRTSMQPTEIVQQEFEPLTYESLGDIDIKKLLEVEEKEESIHEKLLEETIPPEVIIEDVKAFVSQEEYEKIDDPSRIIEDSIASKVLVNAAPGSGKTYTVIRRLEYIIREGLVENFSNILVLVYTNAAKNEILSRLEAGVMNGTLPYTAKNMDICTFDSLATSYLSTIKADFAHLDYNGRIRLFNEKFRAVDFSNFEYLIVDELQDLVNERAKMVLNVLAGFNGGYLLLGDKCQAIYDYDCHDGDNLNSVEFYKRLDEVLGPDVKKYELVGNQRQKDMLAALSNRMRSALLGYDPFEANQCIEDELKTIEIIGSVEEYDFSNITERTAILCRNNGEAEYVSHLLHKKGVRHILLRNIGQKISLHRFIADCLWDYHEVRITRSTFIERYCNRVLDNYEVASQMFDDLSEIIYGDAKEVIEIEKLAQFLSNPVRELPPSLLNEDNSLLTVSTIHKAKGREFDTVFLLDSKLRVVRDNTEESRVWYVGCTRAKTNLSKLSKTNLYFQRSSTNDTRWVQLKTHRSRWTWNLSYHCRNIVLGLPGDFSESGFVSGDFLTALKIQEYIATQIRIGDEVHIELEGKSYAIYHQGQIIGYLSNNMYGQLLSVARESNRASGPPPYLSPVYVTNIITITPSKFPDNVIPYFRESKFWLGLELSGFPRIDWNRYFSNVTLEGSWATSVYNDWSAIK